MRSVYLCNLSVNYLVFSQDQDSQTVADDEDLKAFRTSEADNGDRKLKLKARDDDNYIPHVPSDFHSERGLGVVGSSFDCQAASAVLDIGGDEGEGGRTHKEKMKW